MGYSTRASTASGQHRMNKMIHKKKAAMTTSLLRLGEKVINHGDRATASLTECYESARGKVSCTANSLSRSRWAMDAGTSTSSRMCESSISE